MKHLSNVLCCALSICVVSSEEDLVWWKTASIYQVYPRSFKDSNGDGIGDLNGITQMADHFKAIGVDAVWLSPVYKSPMYDMGYDIVDFCDIDPIFGTMDDFDKLSATLRKKGITLVMDIVPNHSSYLHPWFLSALNTSDPHHEDYKDFYIWREASGWNGTTPLPPNNWISALFDGSTWTWSKERQMFYFHHFLPQQPDLNYRNPNVVSNMTTIMKFWLDKGVMGIRMDAPKFLFENDSFPDQPAVPGTKGNTYATQQQIFSEDQPETFDLLKYWEDWLRTINIEDNVERPMLLEVYDPMTILMKYFGNGVNRLATPFNFDLLGVNQDSTSSDIKVLIMSWMNAIPQAGVSSWVLGNHDNGRVAGRCGPEMVDAMNLLSGVLPGIKVTYNGEEIGMQNIYLRPNQVVDHTINHRDPCRSPLQWDDTDNAGFSSNSSTWLPVNPNYWWLNVAAQMSAQSSHLKVFQEMSRVRKDPVLQRGGLSVLVPDNDTLVIVRNYSASYFALIINLGSTSRTYTSQNLFTPNKLDMDLSVVIGSVNSGFNPGNLLKKGSINVHLKPKAAVLLSSSSVQPSSAPSSHPRMGYLIAVLLVLSHCLRL